MEMIDSSGLYIADIGNTATSEDCHLNELLLMQRIWRFGRDDGSIISSNVRLKRGGRILGHNHSNEASWALFEGRLVFKNLNDEETTRFDSVSSNSEGKITLKGQFLYSKAVHVLTELEKITGTGPANVNPRVAVLVRTHLVNDKLFDLLDILSQSCRYDLFVLADETNGELDVEGYSKLPHSVESCNFHGLSTKHHKILWQCGDYPLYFAAAQIPNYGYYIMIEYDVDLVRKSPVFLEALVSRLQHSGGKWYDLVTENLMEANNPDWFWQKSAKAVYSKPYNSGIFAFVAISKSALSYLLEERRKEARRGVVENDIIHCEAFCASALIEGGYSCVSINDLIDGATEYDSFHASSSDFTTSHFHLGQYHVRSPRVELVHPVYDLDEYLMREYNKALKNGDFASYLAELRGLNGNTSKEKIVLSNYIEMTVANLGQGESLGYSIEKNKESKMDEYADLIRAIVERDVLGKGYDSFNVDLIGWLAAAIESSNYAQQYMIETPRLDKWQMLEKAVGAANLDGLFLEFGVYSGQTIRFLANAKKDITIYGFDSFDGLPESWGRMMGKGTFKMDGLPEVPENVELIVGWFDRTLPSFLDEHAGKPVAFLHVDCDIYSSTQTIFAQLKNRIVAGTIIQFDEYYNYPGWKCHEFRAFQEFVRNQRLGYEYIGVNPANQQVAVRIKG